MCSHLHLASYLLGSKVSNTSCKALQKPARQIFGRKFRTAADGVFSLQRRHPMNSRKIRATIQSPNQETSLADAIWSCVSSTIHLPSCCLLICSEDEMSPALPCVVAVAVAPSTPSDAGRCWMPTILFVQTTHDVLGIPKGPLSAVFHNKKIAKK